LKKKLSQLQLQRFQVASQNEKDQVLSPLTLTNH